MDNSIIYWALGALLTFIILREILTWYWKINEVVTLLKKIENNTRILAKKALFDAQKDKKGEMNVAANNSSTEVLDS